MSDRLGVGFHRQSSPDGSLNKTISASSNAACGDCFMAWSLFQWEDPGSAFGLGDERSDAALAGFPFYGLASGLRLGAFLLDHFALRNNLGGDAQCVRLPLEGGADDVIHKSLMADWIVQHREVSRSWTGGRLEDSAIRIDL